MKWLTIINLRSVIAGSRYGYAISAIASGFASSTVTLLTLAMWAGTLLH
jgi:hypothetical protein